VSVPLALGRINEAAEAAERCTTLDPEGAAGPLLSGCAAVREGRCAEGVRAFARAHELEPAPRGPIANLLFTTFYRDDLSAEAVLETHSSWSRRLAEIAPEPGPAPWEGAGHLAFGSFNRLPKVSAGTLRAWAAVLEAVPSARFVMKALGFADAAVRAAYRERFRALGVAAGRTTLEPPTLGLEAVLAEYSRIDVALDTRPYNGACTTCEVLWRGCRLLTGRAGPPTPAPGGG